MAARNPTPRSERPTPPRRGPANRWLGRPGPPSHLLAGAALALLQGCVVVPRTIETYDPDCRMLTRQMTLDAALLGGFHHCAGDGCVAMLAAAGVITAASAVVSGSIALVGNVVYWFERQGRCGLSRAAEPAS